MFLLWTAIFLKHFLCDFPLQTPYQFLNKGKYGHPGGLIHMCIHFFAMIAIGIFLHFPLWIAIIDGVSHYHIDFFTVWIKKRYNITSTESKVYWIIFGADQCLHYFTYLIIVWLLFAKDF